MPKLPYVGAVRPRRRELQRGHKLPAAGKEVVRTVELEAAVTAAAKRGPVVVVPGRVCVCVGSAVAFDQRRGITQNSTPQTSPPAGGAPMQHRSWMSHTWEGSGAGRVSRTWAPDCCSRGRAAGATARRATLSGAGMTSRCRRRIRCETAATTRSWRGAGWRCGPAAPNRSQHRIPSTNQRPISMGTR